MVPFDLIVVVLIIIIAMAYWRELGSLIGKKHGKKRGGSPGYLAGLAEGVTGVVTTAERPDLLTLVDKDGLAGPFSFTREGIYSISAPSHARKIAAALAAIVADPATTHICDLTACCGGDTIALARVFGRVTSIELSPQNYAALTANVAAYPALSAKITTICGDSTRVAPPADIYHIDPPWGGLDYKKAAAMRLELGGIPLAELAKRFAHIPLLSFKLPANFDANWLIAAMPERQCTVHLVGKFQLICCK
jgi:hypothetical protein